MTFRNRLFQAALASALLAATTLPAQKPWNQPKTADGQPDLQGTWTSATITPFERPPELAGKATLTKEEAAKLEKQAAAASVDDKPVPAGSVGSYNQAFYDGGTKVASTYQTSLVVDPPDGRVPVRPEAEAQKEYNAAHETDGWEYQGPWNRCITRGVPAVMFPGAYNNGYQIFQSKGYVAILAEMIHETRIIPLDTPHLPSSVRLWNGDSRGHWEGNTLVVDTTNYSDKGWIATNANTGRIRGIGISEALHVVERFTRTNADTIIYEATIDDPKIFTRPWKVSIPFQRDNSYHIYEYACHEDNQAMVDMLRGGRVKDKEK